MNKLNYFYRNHPIVSGTTVFALVASIWANIAHQLPLNWLSPEGYARYQRENQFEMPELLKNYIRINPYYTDILKFSNDTILVIDNTQNRIFAITCPVDATNKNGWYCLLRENPITIRFWGLVFGPWVPITTEIAWVPFHLLRNDYLQSTGSSRLSDI